MVTVVDVSMAPFRSLLATPAPCVLITYRKSGTAVASPVWFRFHDGGFEVVIAQSDVKLRRLQHRRDCSLLIFEATPPFRGVRVEGTPTLVPDHHHESRMAIAGRYLGRERAQTFVEQRREPGVVLRMSAEHARTWDLNAILPTA